MVQDLTEETSERKEENIVTLHMNIRNEEEKQRKLSEVVDLCAFLEQFLEPHKFWPKVAQNCVESRKF